MSAGAGDVRHGMVGDVSRDWQWFVARKLRQISADVSDDTDTGDCWRFPDWDGEKQKSPN